MSECDLGNARRGPAIPDLLARRYGLRVEVDEGVAFVPEAALRELLREQGLEDSYFKIAIGSQQHPGGHYAHDVLYRLEHLGAKET